MRRLSFTVPVLGLSFAVLALAFAIVTSQGGEAAQSTAEPAGAGSGFRQQHLLINAMETVSSNIGCKPTGGPFGISGAPGCTSYAAPVHLPNGSKVTAMQVVYEDNSGGADIVILLASSDAQGTADSGTVFRVDSSGTPGKQTVLDTGELVVDNDANHYHLEINVKGDPSLKFISALITYETPAFVAGDVNCSGGLNPVDPIDALGILRWDAGLEVSQNQPCPPIGQ